MSASRFTGGTILRSVWRRPAGGVVLDMVSTAVADAWPVALVLLVLRALTHVSALPTMQIVEGEESGMVIFQSPPCQTRSTDQLRRQLAAALASPSPWLGDVDEDGEDLEEMHPHHSRRRFSRHVVSRRRSGLDLLMLESRLQDLHHRRKLNTSRISSGSGDVDSSPSSGNTADTASTRSTRGPHHQRTSTRHQRGSVDDSETSGRSHHSNQRAAMPPEPDISDSLYDYGFSLGSLPESSGDILFSDAASSSRTSHLVSSFGSKSLGRGSINAYKESQRLPWECKLEPRWKKMEEGIFPPYIQTGRCVQTTCMYGMYECSPVRYVTKVLRRDPERCVPVPLFGTNTTYEEVWEFIRVKVTVACQCTLKRSSFPFMMEADT